MDITEKDIEQLGITYIEVDQETKEISALAGVLKPREEKTFYLNYKFSVITDKIIYWAELEIDYAGG